MIPEDRGKRFYTAIMGMQPAPTHTAPKYKPKGKMPKTKPIEGVASGVGSVLRIFFGSDAGGDASREDQWAPLALAKLSAKQLKDIERKIAEVAGSQFHSEQESQQFHQMRRDTLNYIRYRRNRSRKNLAELKEEILAFLNTMPELRLLEAETGEYRLQVGQQLVHIPSFATQHFPALIKTFEEKVERGSIFALTHWTSGAAFVTDIIIQHLKNSDAMTEPEQENET